MAGRIYIRPHCKICGRFLIGGKDGYCPSTHLYIDDRKLLHDCVKILQDYPKGVERNKIIKQIEKLRLKIEG